MTNGLQISGTQNLSLHAVQALANAAATLARLAETLVGANPEKPLSEAPSLSRSPLPPRLDMAEVF